MKLLVAISLLLVSASAASPSPDEAQRQVQALWETVHIKCGDSYFTKSAICYQQHRNVAFSTQTGSLSDVDRMNGVEWRGSVKIRWAYYREHCGRWADWRKGNEISVSAEKKNGKWTIDRGFLMFDRKNSKPPCNQVPPG